MIWNFEFSTYFYALKNSLMNQMPPVTFLPTSCVNPAQISWIHATDVLLRSSDKADFHAIAAI
jgi:hypothetical protein